MIGGESMSKEVELGDYSALPHKASKKVLEEYGGLNNLDGNREKYLKMEAKKSIKKEAKKCFAQNAIKK